MKSYMNRGKSTTSNSRYSSGTNIFLQKDRSSTNMSNSTGGVFGGSAFAEYSTSGYNVN